MPIFLQSKINFEILLIGNNMEKIQKLEDFQFFQPTLLMLYFLNNIILNAVRVFGLDWSISELEF